jgi:hypothetical protein
MVAFAAAQRPEVPVENPGRLVFLDIDGVLAPAPALHPLSRPESVWFHGPCRERFEAVMRRHPEVQIVIASTWRLVVSLDRIRGRFSPDVAERVQGMTPDLSTSERHARYREVLAYMNLTEQQDARPGRYDARSSPRWVAVDDRPSHYPAHLLSRHVVLTDALFGLDARTAAELDHLLASGRGDGAHGLEPARLSPPF